MANHQLYAPAEPAFLPAPVEARRPRQRACPAVGVLPIGPVKRVGNAVVADRLGRYLNKKFPQPFQERHRWPPAHDTPFVSIIGSWEARLRGCRQWLGDPYANAWNESRTGPMDRNGGSGSITQAATCYESIISSQFSQPAMTVRRQIRFSDNVFCWRRRVLSRCQTVFALLTGGFSRTAGSLSESARWLMPARR